jgi:hypothetical protein
LPPRSSDVDRRTEADGSAARTFFVEHIETPTGRMRLVTDDTHRLRAIDWDDCEARMQDLLLRYYGPNAVTLREALRPSHAAHALAAYFDGDLDAIADLATELLAPLLSRAHGGDSAAIAAIHCV